MLRKILALLGGNAAAALLQLLRNLALARLIPLEDYGIATTFAIAMTVVEMASQLGLQVLIVQSPQGDAPRFQAALQGLQLLRGAVSALALLACAAPIAAFLRVPDVAWAYRVMALVPLLTALQHFDIYRLGRQMRFGPMILSTTLPALLSLLALWPLAALFGDYRVMLYALLLQAGGQALVSHLVAERRYQLALDAQITRGALRFGWPILLNGGLLFAVYQGDKIIVARELGMAAQALFAMGMTLSLTPVLVLQKSAHNFFMPQLSRAAEAHESSGGAGDRRFAALAQATLQGGMVGGALLVVAVLLLGPGFVHLALGPDYAPLAPLLAVFALAQALRAAKGGAGDVALARGRADTAMLSNLPRVAALPLAWWWVLQGGGMAQVLAAALLGELAGLALALAHLRLRLQVPLRPSLPVLALILSLGLPVWLASGPAAAPQLGTQILPQLLALPLLALLLCAARDLRQQLRRRP